MKRRLGIYPVTYSELERALGLPESSVILNISEDTYFPGQLLITIEDAELPLQSEDGGQVAQIKMRKSWE